VESDRGCDCTAHRDRVAARLIWQRIARVGTVIAAVTLGIGVWAHATDRPWQTLVFLALGATQLAVALGSRARPGTRDNPMLFVAVGSALLLQFAAVYLPPLRDLLHTHPVRVTDLLIVGAAATLGYAAIRLDRLAFPHHRPRTKTDRKRRAP